MPTELVPLWLDWRGRYVLVVGMGRVGQRRALMFQRAGAVTIGLDPVPVPSRSDWGELIRAGLELRAEPYDPSIFDELKQLACSPDLVLACATREVNRRVVEDAVARRIWVVSATAGPDDRATAHLGAAAAGDHVQIAVRSGNVAPALAATLRDLFAAQLLAPADRLAEEMAWWRSRITADSSLSPDERRQILSLAGDPELLSREATGIGTGVSELRRMLAARLDEQKAAGDSAIAPGPNSRGD